MPKCALITAGNTSEAIDRVRSITNHASGKLGSIIADAFMSEGIEVVYLCGKNSIQPSQSTVQTVTIEGVSDLLQAVNDLSERYSFDCIVHSMAVSDYTVKGIIPYDELSEAIIHKERPAIYTNPDKLSSDLSNPVILLEKAPKVISKFKDIQPQALLVGFKLLAGVEENELYSAALKLMNKNGCDFVCANDLNNISENKHEALLLDKGGHYIKLFTKEEIANAILNNILVKWGMQK